VLVFNNKRFVFAEALAVPKFGFLKFLTAYVGLHNLQIWRHFMPGNGAFDAIVSLKGQVLVVLQNLSQTHDAMQYSLLNAKKMGGKYINCWKYCCKITDEMLGHFAISTIDL
jgi:hypothetical protein